MALEDEECPVLVILQALRVQGWRPFRGTQYHRTIEDKRFDRREPQQKRCYYQALLALEDLLTVNKTIQSNQPQSYFKLVLKKVQVDPGRGDKVYRAMMASHRRGEVFQPLCDAPGDDQLQLEDDAANDEFDIGGGPAPLEDQGRQQPRPITQRTHPPTGMPELDCEDTAIFGPNNIVANPPPESESSSSESTDQQVQQADDFDLAGAASTAEVVGESQVTSLITGWVELNVAHCCCPGFKVDNYQPSHAVGYQRLIAKCKWHINCEKKRASKFNATHGKIEPIAFLAAWHEQGESISREQHTSRKFKVRPEDTATWVTRLSGNAQQVVDLIVVE